MYLLPAYSKMVMVLNFLLSIIQILISMA